MQSLNSTGGGVNKALLDKLAAIAVAQQSAGGEVLLMMPPLLPGLERSLMDSPSGGDSLKKTKQQLDAWSRAHGLAIIDAGQSEQYGCIAQEFVDQHHALPTCYIRVFERVWAANRDGNRKIALVSSAVD